MPLVNTCKAIPLERFCFKVWRISLEQRRKINHKPNNSTAAIRPWSCHQSLPERVVWGIKGNLAVDEAIRWVFSCASNYDSTLKPLQPTGRDCTLLATVVLSGVVGYAVRRSHRVWWAYSKARGTQVTNVTFPNSYDSFSLCPVTFLWTRQRSEEQGQKNEMHDNANKPKRKGLINTHRCLKGHQGANKEIGRVWGSSQP